MMRGATRLAAGLLAASLLGPAWGEEALPLPATAGTPVLGAPAPSSSIDDGFGGVKTSKGVVTPVPDLAFGAFQRGYFATALKEAMARIAKNRHDGAAMALVGEIYAQGLAVNKDLGEAAKWDKLAAQQGNREGTFAYGMALLTGNGAPKDRDAARTMLERAAAAGHPGALYNLGVMAVEGDGKGRDFAKAADYFQKAADAGDITALEALSALYRQGRGVPQDLPRAIALLKQAADEKDASAAVQYAIALFNGEGVPKDETGAARYFLLAATAGNPIAENRLARLYAAGRGVPKNAIEAARWHILARAAGIKDAWLDGVLTGLTPAERGKVEEALKRQLAF